MRSDLFMKKYLYQTCALGSLYIYLKCVCVLCESKMKFNYFPVFFALLDNTNKIPKRVNVSKQLFSTSMH